MTVLETAIEGLAKQVEFTGHVINNLRDENAELKAWAQMAKDALEFHHNAWQQDRYEKGHCLAECVDLCKILSLAPEFLVLEAEAMERVIEEARKLNKFKIGSDFYDLRQAFVALDKLRGTK